MWCDPGPPIGRCGVDEVVHVLRTRVSGTAVLSDSDLRRVASLLSLRHVAKGETLLSPGDVCGFEVLVLRGCLRVFFTESDGSERVLSFAPEGWWVTDIESFLWGQPSSLGVTAVEATDVLVIDKPAMAQLQTQVPGCVRILRLVAEGTLVALQRRLIGSMRKSATQRYVEFRRIYPGLDRRIPQYQIAAYLGITAEFLSKLRRRLPETRES